MATTTATAIRDFTVEIPQADIDDLRARIAATRFPERETVDDQTTKGAPKSALTEVGAAR
ncbi:MAG: epoxide hydrolase N-terminal domain-containing protein [Gaiellaceae bacterium]